MSNKRPVNLNLFTIKFPIPAIVSILHRISGVILFLSIPLILWGFHLSLHSQASFQQLTSMFDERIYRFIAWIVLSALIYHIVAGLRHLMMDMGIGETYRGGQVSAFLVVIMTIVLIVLAGIWLW